MTPENILGICLSRDIRLTIANGGNDMNIDAPIGGITPYIRQCLIENKRPLISMLELSTNNEINELYELG